MPPLALSRVPPQPTTYGLDAGKSTCALPSPTPSVARLSPLAANTVTPSVAASLSAAVIAASACAVHVDSAEPQLIEMTDGRFVVSWTAVLIASTKPWLVFGAKYTAIRAPGATPPAT